MRSRRFTKTTGAPLYSGDHLKRPNLLKVTSFFCREFAGFSLDQIEEVTRIRQEKRKEQEALNKKNEKKENNKLKMRRREAGKLRAENQRLEAKEDRETKNKEKSIEVNEFKLKERKVVFSTATGLATRIKYDQMNDEQRKQQREFDFRIEQAKKEGEQQEEKKVLERIERSREAENERLETLRTLQEAKANATAFQQQQLKPSIEADKTAKAVRTPTDEEKKEKNEKRKLAKQQKKLEQEKKEGWESVKPSKKSPILNGGRSETSTTTPVKKIPPPKNT